MLMIIYSTMGPEVTSITQVGLKYFSLSFSAITSFDTENDGAVVDTLATMQGGMFGTAINKKLLLVGSKAVWKYCILTRLTERREQLKK